ncbi:hypothetical protein GQ43DRAFT_481687 [Delitschia confertaspora ATCC 74209]|uniref:Uncharacterized protein n=1 Tax=Delitschia confertaspora ATCC 74209 TaxID=1513339 RepID=A0A9P4MP77_9PLEO|nr:hypothetical protein GQ43DRAFT_481687 [Delitschia confertaspora ATCC 74209]
MGRSRGPKFSFPIPGRKSAAKNDIEEIVSVRSIPSLREWSSRDEPHASKAERLLGASGLSLQPSLSNHSQPQSPEYMTITVSEASFGSEYSSQAATGAVEDRGLSASRRPGMVPRASSNLLGDLYQNDRGRRGSNSSAVSKRLCPQASNSTMRSHYEAQSSPLAVSQQTSASSARDMGLRKDRPRIISEQRSYDQLSKLAAESDKEAKRANRKSKPTRLDLSKLFPKPKGNTGFERNGGLLSPNKFVNSPTAMSTSSEFYSRPESTKSSAKLTKKTGRQGNTATQPPQSSSPVRVYKRDVYDNAKVNVRRPPRGIQNWFDGLSEESEEDQQEADDTIRIARPVTTKASAFASLRETVQTKDVVCPEIPYRANIHHPLHVRFPGRKEGYAGNGQFHTDSPKSPTQYSVQSQTSNRTKESAFSRPNLQNSSVLSFSSSDSEGESNEAQPSTNFPPPRESYASFNSHNGPVIIGKAQTFDVRARNRTRPASESKASVRSVSTSAATIEVMYTPEPYTSSQGNLRYGGSRRSSHVRQPSVIPEDEVQPPSSSNGRSRSDSASTGMRSMRTTGSEPTSRAEQHSRLMAVSEEEEALLEMMRKKRAAMAQQSFTEGYKTAMQFEQSDERQTTSPRKTRNAAPRTSGFLSMDSPSPSPLLLPVPRQARRKPSQNSSVKTVMSRESLASGFHLEGDAGADDSPAVLNYRLSLGPDFSSLDMFPSPYRNSVATSTDSPTPTSHASPLPSPVTPGPRNGEADLQVRVAGSEPSCNGDEDVPVNTNGVIEPLTNSVKTGSRSNSHQRRRTASSGAEVPFEPPTEKLPPVPKQPIKTEYLNHLPQLPPTSEIPSYTLGSSAVETQQIPRKSSRRSNAPAPITTSRTSRHNSTIPDRQGSKVTALSRGNSIRRESITPTTISARCSVSEDVLAAWGSLGGWRDYDSGRIY